MDFDIAKATEAACQFLKLEKGHINVMKLVKLVYLLDRLSIERRCIPVVGGVYYSMRNGPVTGELLDLINSGCLWKEDCHWEEFISDCENHELKLVQMPDCEHLSDSEVRLIEEIYLEHGTKDQWELRNWCDLNCGEWTPTKHGRHQIELEDVARNVGKTEAEATRIGQEASESNLVATVLSWQ